MKICTLILHNIRYLHFYQEAIGGHLKVLSKGNLMFDDEVLK